jgi:hypothetical protein
MRHCELNWTGGPSARLGRTETGESYPLRRAAGLPCPVEQPPCSVDGPRLSRTSRAPAALLNEVFGVEDFGVLVFFVGVDFEVAVVEVEGAGLGEVEAGVEDDAVDA